MTTKTFKDKNDNEWSFQETPETIQALKELYEAVKKSNDRKKSN